MGIIKNRATTVVHYFILTFFTGEFFVFLNKQTYTYKSFFDDQKYYWFALFLVLMVIFAYKFISLVVKIVKDKRWEILLSILVPLVVLFFLNNSLLADNIFKDIDVTKGLLTIFLLGIFFSLIALIIIIKSLKKEIINEPFFISDEPVENSSQDLFGISADASIFADQVLNNFSDHSIVFGLDAPWGNGKSSYIKFCKNKWKEYNDILVFEFDPLRFENSSNLFSVFINEFIKILKKNNFVPEVRNSLIRYSKIISAAKFGVFDFSIPSFETLDWEESFDELQENLKIINKKIIILIDDLDRIPFKDAKIILDIVKKSFTLHNVTYVLCYDTENINILDFALKNTYSESENFQSGNIIGTSTKLSEEKLNNNKTIEYLEKVVNIKKTLVIPRKKLEEYILTELNKSNELGRYFSTESMEKIFKAISFIFDPENFPDYEHYIGNLRKIKRFLNIIKMQIINNIDISIRDIDFVDLFNLILIYINYPWIFRKIYLYEIDGANNFFSLETNFINREIVYQNSIQYKAYTKLLSKPEKKLVGALFDAENFSETTGFMGSDESQGFKKERKTYAKFTSAAFNGLYGTSKNLESYLKLIIERKPADVKQEFNFHFTNFKKFIDGNATLEEIFNQDNYLFKNDNNADYLRDLFFKRLIDSNQQLTYKKSQEVVDYILLNLDLYSSISVDEANLKLRQSLVFDLVYILDNAGWKDSKGESYNNTPENVIEIARRVFGENEYENKGVLNLLSCPNRGIVGFNDLMVFRLSSSQDRGGSFFNFYTALATHADPNATTFGDTTDLAKHEMREISQKCFKIFCDQYIDLNKNLFVEVNSLNSEKLFSSSYSYVLGKIANIDEQVIFKKQQMINFIVYQISNNKINMGIGCGLYDEQGIEDGGGIRVKFNKYLFDFCFLVTDENMSGAEYFVDLLLTNYKRSQNFSRGMIKYEPDFGTFQEILDSGMLTNYWTKNGNKIKKYFRNINRTFPSFNYNISYTKDLPSLFDLLDTKASETSSNNPVREV